MNQLTALKRFVAAGPPLTDVCALCAVRLPDRHLHLYDREKDTLECACIACSMLFSERNAQRWLRVERFSQRLEVSPVDVSELPIGLAFITKRGAFYPGPAGATRCTLQLPPLELDETHAILINRLGETQRTWRVSIDVCFELVGLIRRNWRGFSGGAAMKDAVEHFFGGLDA